LTQTARGLHDHLPGFTGKLQDNNLSIPTGQQSYTKLWLMQRCCRENATVSTINDNERRLGREASTVNSRRQ
jgi:hypothetical protein